MSGASKERLREVYLSSIKRSGFFNTFIYRKISIQFVRIFVFLGLTPNGVTLLAFFLNLFAFLLFSQGIYQLSLIALIPLNLAIIFDLSDGQLAILLDRKTKLGAFLDPFLDRVADLLILGGLSYGFFVSSGKVVVLYIFILFVAIRYLLTVVDHTAVIHKSPTGAENLRKIDYLILPILSKYIRWDGGFSAVLISLCVILNQIPLLITCFFLMALITLFLATRSLLLTLWNS